MLNGTLHYIFNSMNCVIINNLLEIMMLSEQLPVSISVFSYKVIIGNGSPNLAPIFLTDKYGTQYKFIKFKL